MSGHQNRHQVQKSPPNGQGAGATTARKNDTAPALTESWRGSGTARRKRGGAESEGTGRNGGPAAQTETKTEGSVKRVAAGTERTNAGTKKETAGTTRTRGKRGNTIKTEA